MKLTTSRGIDYDALWAGQSLARPHSFLAHLPGERPLVELICELDGILWAKTSGPEGQPDREYQGPMRIISASRTADGSVLIDLDMEAAT